MARTTGAAGRSVTSKILAILETFSEETPRRSLTEIADAIRAPLSTTHRLVAELQEWGGLVRLADGRYEIGSRMWNLGLLASRSRELRDVALPFMQDLAATTGENVHIAVREGHQSLYVEHIAGTRSVPLVSRIGSRLPLHATGVGKVLLAHADQDTLKYVLTHLTRHTPYTVIEPGRLARQLAEVRRRGYAQSAEEMSIGTLSLAVPVHGRRHGGHGPGQDSATLAALGVVTAIGRRELLKLLPALQLAARGISRSFVR